MKKQKIDPKMFLKAKTLSPLEQNQIRGGKADKVKVKVKVTETETETE